MRQFSDTLNTDAFPRVEGGQPCHIERAIADLVAREFSLAARIERARKSHRARRHLLRFQRLSKAAEIAA